HGGTKIALFLKRGRQGFEFKLALGLLVDFRAPGIDIGLGSFDLAIDPLLQVLLGAEDLQDRIDGGEIEPPKDCRQRSAYDRHQEPDAIVPGETNRTHEVLHAYLSRGLEEN